MLWKIHNISYCRKWNCLEVWQPSLQLTCVTLGIKINFFELQLFLLFYILKENINSSYYIVLRVKENKQVLYTQ